MNKFFLFLAATIGLLAFSSCRDYEPQEENSEVNNDDAPVRSNVDYLIMLYGAGGGSLDTCIVGNIVQAIDEGGSDKVAMTFEYKPSKKLQTEQSLKNFDGARRFTLDENAHLQGQFKSMSKDYPKLDNSSFNYYVDNIKSEKIGGSDYDMSNHENLAEFISWSKKKYPKAKRTILVLTGHGNGWTMADGHAQLESQQQSRTILPDDNIDNYSLLTIDVTNGITKGGGVDLLYTDACLMSMYENIYTYAKAVRYLLTAVETTPGEGGDYRMLLSVLKAAGTTDADLEGAMHKYADHCVSDQWWGKKDKDGDISFSDLGLYDLSRLDAVTPVLKEIVSTMTEKFSGTESIKATADELPLSDNFAPYIRKSVTQCVMSHKFEYYKLQSLPEALLPYLRKDLKVIKFKEDENEYFASSQVIDWVKYASTENAVAAYKALPDDWNELRQYIIDWTYMSYSLTDLLRQIDLELSAVGAQNNPFTQLRADLVSAIKSIAYITCTEPVKLPNVDQAYEYCSPGIFIVPFNDNYKTNNNPYYASLPKFEEALERYQAMDFDQAVGWSNFLKVLDVTPSVLHNPARSSLKNAQTLN